MEADKTAKRESGFYFAEIIHDAKEKMETRANIYNEKYIKKRVETGREFITELKADPVKTIDDLIYDSGEMFEKMRSARVNILQRRIDTAKEDIQEKIEQMNQKIRPVYKGLGNDAKLISGNFIAFGKKSLDRLPMKKTIEKKISAGAGSIPAKLNLPSKTEMDNLLRGLEGINRKVDGLNKKYADM